MPESVTNLREDKELGDALDGELLLRVANREQAPANPGNTHAEGARRRRCQGGNVVGDGPLVEVAIALVAAGDEGLHVSIGRELPGRYSFGLRVVAGEGIVVHALPLAAGCWPTSTRWPGSAGPMVSGCPIREQIRGEPATALNTGHLACQARWPTRTAATTAYWHLISTGWSCATRDGCAAERSSSSTPVSVPACSGGQVADQRVPR